MTKKLTFSAAQNGIAEALDLIARHSIQNDGFKWHFAQDIKWSTFNDAAWADFQRLKKNAAAPTLCALQTLDSAIARLGDKHSLVWHQDYYKRRDGTFVPFCLDQINTASVSPPMPLVDQKDGLLYIDLPGFDPTRRTPEDRKKYVSIVSTALIQAKKAFTRGCVLDLRRNCGGNKWPMLVALSPLLSPEPLGFYRGPNIKAAWTINTGSVSKDAFTEGFSGVDEKDRTNFWFQELPVCVITGAQTCSAGELVSLSFRGRPNTTSFGQETKGCSNGTMLLNDFSSGNILFQERNLRIYLTTNIAQDRHGIGDGGPLRPDFRTENPIRRAQAWFGHNPYQPIPRTVL